MYKYALFTVSILFISSIAYAISSQETIEERVERENRETLMECLDNASKKSTTQEILQAKNDCSESILTKIIVPINNTWTLTTGNAVVPSKTVEEAKKKFDYAKLYQDVCKQQINSPLCKDRALFDRLYHITEERLPWKNFYPILLGITNAESSLGLNFAKDNTWGTCAGRNNWGGIKWKINDDWSRQRDQKIPDKYGCYLYKFNSIEEYWISKVNTVRFWYKWCVDHNTPIRCMSYSYVGDRNVAEESWIKNTSIFLD